MILGITGNSGVGKSFLIQNLKVDYFLIDADKIGHKCLLMTECKAEIVSVFGNEVLENDEINRKKLGEIVFLDKEKLKRLTEITHKYILKEIERLILENLNKFKLIIIDAPLLVEAGLHKKCDKSILVTAEYSEKIKRIMERDNISEELAVGRLSKQSNDSLLEKNVDIIFENSYNLKAINSFNNIVNAIVSETNWGLFLIVKME